MTRAEVMASAQPSSAAGLAPRRSAARTGTDPRGCAHAGGTLCRRKSYRTLSAVDSNSAARRPHAQTTRRHRRQQQQQAAAAATHVRVVVHTCSKASAPIRFGGDSALLRIVVCNEMLLKVGMYFMCPSEFIQNSNRGACVRPLAVFTIQTHWHYYIFWVTIISSSLRAQTL